MRFLRRLKCIVCMMLLSGFVSGILAGGFCYYHGYNDGSVRVCKEVRYYYDSEMRILSCDRVGYAAEAKADELTNLRSR